MKINASGKFAIPKWTWILTAISSLAIIGGIWWASYASALRESRQWSQPAKVVGVSVQPISPAEGRGVLVQSVGTEARGAARAPATVKPRPEKCNPLRGMFPIGDITKSTPQERHAFRKVAELFPSFGYGGQLWVFTGSFASTGQLDLVPTGFTLRGRQLYALSNTVGLGTVLFVQSGQNPSNYAIYRYGR